MSGFINEFLSLIPQIINTSAGDNNDVAILGGRVMVTVTNPGDAITGFSTGFSATAKGTARLEVFNVSASNNLILKHDTGSAVGERISIPGGGNLTIAPNQMILLTYRNGFWSATNVPVTIPPATFGAVAQKTPANPATTTSAAGVMMGLAAAGLGSSAATLAPTKSGNLMVTISGSIDNAVLLAGATGATAQIRFGTGTAPVNGAALTGTAVGGSCRVVNPLIALLTPGVYPLSLNAVIPSLSVGTTYWFDISLTATGGGTARVRDLSVSIIEIA